jgi:hypothetical protein
MFGHADENRAVAGARICRPLVVRWGDRSNRSIGRIRRCLARIDGHVEMRDCFAQDVVAASLSIGFCDRCGNAVCLARVLAGTFERIAKAVRDEEEPEFAASPSR